MRFEEQKQYVQELSDVERLERRLHFLCYNSGTVSVRKESNDYVPKMSEKVPVGSIFRNLKGKITQPSSVNMQMEEFYAWQKMRTILSITARSICNLAP